MAKILALDVGTKRIGCAISDEGQTMAFPRGVIRRLPEESCIASLQKLITGEKISKIIVGVPLDRDNEETPASQKIRRFGEKLARTTSLPIEYVDEFGSSDEALSKIPLRKDRRTKGAVDAIAALIILERYLSRI